ncbi:ATP-dependent DNA helicase RecQ [Algivirga pacifica]|uniref:ATP-dependent DNA helicase RecQ n=1 Tax=Algivirga pacifica TaxID=1162670 RepID=A0ABP9D5F3_9BACT
MTNFVNSHQLLHRFWGYEDFRQPQEEIIKSAVSATDTLALLPTGGGKSICFQVAALMRRGVCLVVTPLIALMKDQVYQLQKRGIPAAALHSQLTPQEQEQLFIKAQKGHVKFLYLSPERLLMSSFLEAAAKMEIGLLAIDEAHCISQWGYDFRPSYLSITKFREHFPEVPCIALTATATKSVKEDIILRLNFQEGYKVFSKSFLRENLSYAIRKVEDKDERLMRVLEGVEGSAIVYVRSRIGAEQVAYTLAAYGVKADFYHAGLPADVRSLRQDQWIKGDLRVMVATNAFGMGIDKPDVRLVVHYDIPTTLEAYYQEAGRAGRDGKEAYAVLLMQSEEVEKLQERWVYSHPSIQVLKKLYAELVSFFKLATGKEEILTLPFLMEEFIENSTYNSLEVFYGLRRLEEQGVLALEEPLGELSKIWVKASVKERYQYRVSNIRFDRLLLLLERYCGPAIYSGLQDFSESLIATHMNCSVKDLEGLLNEMQEEQLLIYRPKETKSKLRFFGGVYTGHQLPLKEEIWENRREAALEQWEAMKNYLMDGSQCRTNILQEYFDEKPDRTCGICDNCRKRKIKENRKENEQQWRFKILGVLENGTVSIEVVERLLGENNKEEWLPVLRKMLDENVLKRLPNGDITQYKI